eukprot:Lankesteria_metandrocarpae@DN5375_c1_g1_i11.p2
MLSFSEEFEETSGESAPNSADVGKKRQKSGLAVATAERFRRDVANKKRHRMRGPSAEGDDTRCLLTISDDNGDDSISDQTFAASGKASVTWTSTASQQPSMGGNSQFRTSAKDTTAAAQTTTTSKLYTSSTTYSLTRRRPSADRTTATSNANMDSHGTASGHRNSDVAGRNLLFASNRLSPSADHSTADATSTDNTTTAVPLSALPINQVGCSDASPKRDLPRSTPEELYVAAEAVKCTLAADFTAAQLAVRRDCALGLGPVEALRDFGSHMEACTGAATTQGRRRDMEDECIVVEDLVKLSSPQHVVASYVGLFDGHKGSTCAREAKMYIHRHVSSKLTAQRRYAEAISESRLTPVIMYDTMPTVTSAIPQSETEGDNGLASSFPEGGAGINSSLVSADLNKVCTDVFAKFDSYYGKSYPLAQDGTTALLSFLEVSTEQNWAVLHIVNAGDCRAVLARSKRPLPDVQKVKVNITSASTASLRSSTVPSTKKQKSGTTSLTAECPTDTTSLTDDAAAMDWSVSDTESASAADEDSKGGEDEQSKMNLNKGERQRSPCRTRCLPTSEPGAAEVLTVRSLVVEDLIAIRLSEDHKPGVPSETKRILASKEGGIVNMGCPRVSIRGINQFLAVSRCLGNHHLKKHGPSVIISQPTTTATALLPFHDSFAVLATDGLWDVVTDMEAVQIAGEVFAADEEFNLTKRSVPSRRRKTLVGDAETFAGAMLESNASSMVARKAAEKLVTTALEKGSQDNVTVVVIRFVWKI